MIVPSVARDVTRTAASRAERAHARECPALCDISASPEPFARCAEGGLDGEGGTLEAVSDGIRRADLERDTCRTSTEESRRDPDAPSRGRTARQCSWCRGAIAVTARSDAKYCSKACRQAGHRAKVRRASIERDASPLRFAYADPPYIGQASLYVDHPDYAGEVDHGELLARLEEYDGWALSCSAASLPLICALAVERDVAVRVAAWTRAPRPHATARVLNAWEPVVLAGGRRVAPAGVARVDAVTDVLAGVTPRRRSTHPGWLVGSKPPAFCEWVFDLLGAGAHPDDTLDDLFPGSGIVARSWRLRLGLEAVA